MEKLDRIKELVALLNKAGKSYYSEGQEIMSNMMLYMMNLKSLKRKLAVCFRTVLQ